MPKNPNNRGRWGSEQLDRALAKLQNQYGKDGWRTLPLHGKSPNLIAVRDGVVVAVVLMRKIKRQGQKVKTKTGASKREAYSMFDRVDVFYVRADDPTDEPIPALQ